VSAVLTEFIEIIDLSEVPPASRRDVAADTLAYLMDIFGRIDPIALEDAPGAGDYPDDGSTVSWRIPGTPLRIVRMTEGDKQGEFLFGPRTPVLAERFFRRVEDLPLRQETDLLVQSWTRTFPQWTGPMIPAGTALAMPQALRDFAFDTPIWKIILVGLVTLVLAGGIALVHRLVAGHGGRAPLAILRRGVTPALMLGAVAWMGPFLQFQVSPAGDFAAATKVALVFVWYAALAWLAWITVKALFAWIVRLRGLDEEGFNADLWRLGGTVLALLVSVIIIGDGATQLGLPVFSVLAGLGIGGLAVALAIRPTLENLIGGIILYLDQPVRVGDFCTFGGQNGTIESIGIRSTKIRALDRTLISVSNAQFADTPLINWARCDKMLIRETIGVRYETTPDQLRFVLARTREMLHSHPRIDPQTIRVRFAGYGDSSLKIDLRIYAKTQEWNDFFAIREDVFLRIYDIVTGAGTGFAFPSQTVYLGRDEGLDETARDAAEQQVHSWRTSGRLPFPRLPEKRQASLEGILDYPPRGSFEAGGDHPQVAVEPERLSGEPIEQEHRENKQKSDI